MKNKILPILCVFILISCLFINNEIFATTTEENFTCTYDGVTYTMPSLPEDVYNYKYIVIVKSTKNTIRYRILVSNEPFIYTDTCVSFPERGVDCITQGNKSFYEKVLDSEDGWTFYSGGGYHISGFLKPSKDYWYTMCYTNADICDESGTVFFRKTPIAEMTLATVLEKNNPVESFQTMMSGMIPYLIAFLVGLVAFWKAWQFLLKVLRKA